MTTDALYFPADQALKAMGDTSRRWPNHIDLNKVYSPPGVNPFVYQGRGRGKQRQLPLETIIQGRIAFTLIDCGVDVRAAYRICSQFVYLGNMPESFSFGSGRQFDPARDRAAGRLFATGTTYLVHSVAPLEPHENNTAIISDADPAFNLTAADTALAAILHAVDGEGSAPRIVLNLSAICAEIAASLSLDFTTTFVTGVA